MRERATLIRIDDEIFLTIYRDGGLAGQVMLTPAQLVVLVADGAQILCEDAQSRRFHGEANERRPRDAATDWGNSGPLNIIDN
jgi:hypothetical protein